MILFRKKNFFCFLISIIMLFCTPMSAMATWADPPQIEAESGIVIDADSGCVLAETNARTRYAPASITKLLTALVVLEHKSDLADTVVFSDNALFSVERGSGNKLSLQSGDSLSLEDALCGLLLVSANQCANALAEYTAGSIDVFVDMMNDKVAELGLSDSHFENPSGLNGDDQYVTAADMAVIAQAAFEDPILLDISSRVRHHIGPTGLFPDGQTIKNEHRLVNTTDESSEFFCPQAVAGKTGYLLSAGNTLVTYGTDGDRRVISVILKGRPRQYFLDGKALLLFGLEGFKNIRPDTELLSSAGDALTAAGITSAAGDLSWEESGLITLPADAPTEDLSITFKGPAEDSAADGYAGSADFYYDGRFAGNVRLVSSSDILLAEETQADMALKETQAAEDTAETAAASSRELSLPAISLSKNAIIMILFIIVCFCILGIAACWISARVLEKRRRAAFHKRRLNRLAEMDPQTRQLYEQILREKWNK